MYEEYFSLSSPPFRLAPDTRFFYGSRSHNKAMAYLHYGLRQAEGFIVITGQIGAGKSMLISHLLEQLNRSNVVAAHLLTPNLKPDELLAHILSAFRIEPAGKGKTAEIEAFEDFLFDQMNRGRRVLLIVDEAQNLPAATIEELRILSNMEYQGTPLFQVFLVGQPDFRDLMARPDMEQLRQRVIATYHLEAMSREETESYIRHRLTVAGWAGNPSIAAGAFDAVHAATSGLPRKINKLCTRIFLLAALEKRTLIDGVLAQSALADLESEGRSAPLAANDAHPPYADLASEPEEAPDAEAVNAAAFAVAAAPVADRATPSDIAPAQTRTQSAGAASRPILSEGVTMSSDKSTLTPLTLFDRIKAGKARAAAQEPAPSPATLDDVADAIAAVKDQPTSNGAARAVDTQAEDTPADAPFLPNAVDSGVENDDSIAPPLVAEGANTESWRRAVVASINETRDELKLARQNVAKIRRRLSDLDKARELRRGRLVASLDRAQTMLGEIGDARS